MAGIDVGRPRAERGESTRDLNPATAAPSEEVVREISDALGEPGWLLELRLRGLRCYLEMPARLPRAAVGPGAADGNISYLRRFRLNSPQTGALRAAPERTIAGAAGATVDLAQAVEDRNSADLEKLGVVFSDLDRAVVEHPDIVRRFLCRLVPPEEGGFAALNTAVFAGGSFIYVPEGVRVDVPLQSFLSVTAERRGAFERTLVIAEAGSDVQYIEGCSAPVYSVDALHVGVVELVALPGSRVNYTTIQNWSRNVSSVVIKRAHAEAEAQVRWVDGSIGSRFARTRPSIYLRGPKATGEALSVTYAGASQIEDTGARMVHLAPETVSDVIARSVSKDGGRTTYRPSLQLGEHARYVKSRVRSDVLVLDDDSIAETVPSEDSATRGAIVDYEASASRITADQVFYLMTRGLSEPEAASLIVNGFIEPVTRTLPVEYAVEWARLVSMQMESSVG